MCGLAGFVGYLEAKHRIAMRDLMYLTALRGKDSTGLTSVHRDRTVATRKMTIPAYEFIEIPAVDRVMQHADQVWLGHCRFKTTGSVSRANAHPFEVLDNDGDILLVGTHNGTLDNKWEIEKLVGGDKFETDSEALFNWLVEAKDFKEAISKIRGAWSLVWWDPTTDSVHFCRNDQRPLVYSYTKDKKAIVYASEAWMILAACRRNNVELLTNDKGLSCYSTIADSLYTVKIPQDRDKELPDLVREGGYVGAPARNFQDGNKRWNSWWDQDREEREKEEAERKKAGKADGKEEAVVYHLGKPPVGLRGFNGSDLSLVEFARIRGKGCVWCKKKLTAEQPFAFIAEEDIVCNLCIRDIHPKGDNRPEIDYSFIDEDEDFLDDDLPLSMETPEGKKMKQEALAGIKKIIGA